MKIYKSVFSIFLLLMLVKVTSASEFRVNQIPNGTKFSCSNCHVSPAGGGPRNAFGQLVEKKYLNSQGNVVWGAAIAAEDADGDGISNGQELQDPTGTWKVGQSNPGSAALVTNPGDKNSKPTGIESLQMPTTYRLAQNYPNPFNPSTVIKYQIPKSSYTTLKVFDILGNEVATLVDRVEPAGNYSITFAAKTLASGIYFYRLTSGEFIETKKFTLIR